MTETPVVISFIVPVFNAATTIKCCIDSILNQAYQECEIICIDDGSTDRSYEILSIMATKDSRIKIFVQNNQGVSSARNTGLRYAEGEWIFFVDADDVIAPNAIMTIMKQLKKRPQSDLMIFGMAHSINGRIESLDYAFMSDYPSKDDVYKAVFCDNTVKGYVCNKLFKRHIIYNNRIKFREDVYMNEDLLFCAEYLKFTNQIIYIKTVLYIYAITTGSATQSPISEKSMSFTRSFKILKEMYGNSKYSVYVDAAYINMAVFLMKKAIKFGVKKKVYFQELLNIVKIGKLSSIRHLDKNQRKYFIIFRYLPMDLLPIKEV